MGGRNGNSRLLAALIGRSPGRRQRRIGADPQPQQSAKVSEPKYFGLQQIQAQQILTRNVVGHHRSKSRELIFGAGTAGGVEKEGRSNRNRRSSIAAEWPRHDSAVAASACFGFGR